MVGVIPSIIAALAGTLPVVLTPMIPYIIIGNIILILIFSFLKNKNYWLAVGVASFSKFVFLYVSSFIIFDLLMKKELAANILIMMNWPQLITAAAGGVLIGILYKTWRKTN